MNLISKAFESTTNVLFTICFALMLFGPLVAHVVWCVEAAERTGSAVALLIVGLAMFPIGWIHGFSVLIGIGGWV